MIVDSGDPMQSASGDVQQSLSGDVDGSISTPFTAFAIICGISHAVINDGMGHFVSPVINSPYDSFASLGVGTGSPLFNPPTAVIYDDIGGGTLQLDPAAYGYDELQGVIQLGGTSFYTAYGDFKINPLYTSNPSYWGRPAGFSGPVYYGFYQSGSSPTVPVIACVNGAPISVNCSVYIPVGTHSINASQTQDTPGVGWGVGTASISGTVILHFTSAGITELAGTANPFNGTISVTVSVGGYIQIDMSDTTYTINGINTGGGSVQVDVS